MSRSPLRESVQQLREYMFSASSYPGPEPGKMWSLGTGYAGTPNANVFRDLEKEKKDEKERQMKRRKADFRTDLRKLSVWLQQKRSQ